MAKEQELGLRRQALEEERRRREHVERRLQSESSRRQQLVEKEVKLREKQFTQVRGWAVAGDGLRWGRRVRDRPGTCWRERRSALEEAAVGSAQAGSPGHGQAPGAETQEA